MSWQGWRVEAAIGYPPDAAAPTWTDLTSYVDTIVAPTTTTLGRQSEMAADEPATWTLTLNNAGHEFTAGNTASPLYGIWDGDTRFRLVETIGYRSYVLADGWATAPEIDDYADPGIDQQITITITDRITRLGEVSGTMLSVLGEWIRYHGGSQLVGFWTLADADFPTLATSTSASSLDGALARSTKFAFSGGYTGGTLFSPAAADPLPGDDLPRALWSPQLSGTTDIADTDIFTYLADPITVATGDTLTVMCWARSTSLADTSTYLIELSGSSTLDDLLLRRTTTAETPGNAVRLQAGRLLVWTVTANAGAWTSNVDALIGAQLTLSGTPETRLWVDDQPEGGTANTLSGTPTASMTFNRISIGGGLTLSGFTGSISYVQIYLTPAGATAPTWTDHQAQRTAGLDGLAGQTSGERVDTIATYAGLPAGLRADIDDGTTLMAAARFAGRTRAEAIAEAVTTEQGRLYAGPDTRLVFDSRTRRYVA